MKYSDIYELHLQIFQAYEIQTKHPFPEQTKIDYFKRQLNIFAEDIVQRIFVLNQLIKIYEENRITLVNGCKKQYFSLKSSLKNED